MSIGLLIGRFQPFHLGHLSAIKQALSEVESLIIGIGSAQYSHAQHNPFSSDERRGMIEMALQENGIEKDKFEIIPIPDINNNPKWPSHVRSLVPSFDILFIGNDGIVKELFEKYDNVPIKKVKKEVPVCATDIRTAIKNGEDYTKYLSKSTIEYLEKINGIERIKSAP